MLIPLLLLASCVSSSARTFTVSDRRAALEVLGRDMIDEARQVSAEAAAAHLERFLSDTYTVYEPYVPLYGEIQERYLGSLASLVCSISDDVYDIVLSSLEATAASDPDSIVRTAQGLTAALQDANARRVYGFLVDEAIAAAGEISSAFHESWTAFMSVRDAYLNLASAGYALILPPPQPISSETLAFAAEDYLFSRLSDAEDRLRGELPESDDSPYAVFWEVRP